MEIFQKCVTLNELLHVLANCDPSETGIAYSMVRVLAVALDLSAEVLEAVSDNVG